MKSLPVVLDAPAGSLPQGTAGDLELQIGVQPSTVTAPRLRGILVGLVCISQDGTVFVAWHDVSAFLKSLVAMTTHMGLLLEK